FFNPLEIRMNPKGHGEIHYSDTGDKIELGNLGELAGYIDARDKDVVEYMGRLDKLVETLAREINTIHEGGTGLDGGSGEKFFIFDDSNPAATIVVNPELADYNKI